MSLLAELVASLRVWKRERLEAERHDLALRYKRVRALADAAVERRTRHEERQTEAEARHLAEFWRTQGVEWRQTNPCWREDGPRYLNIGRPVYRAYRDGHPVVFDGPLPEPPPFNPEPFRFTRAELLAIRDAELLRLRIDDGMTEVDAKRFLSRQRDVGRRISGRAFREYHWRNPDRETISLGRDISGVRDQRISYREFREQAGIPRRDEIVALGPA